MKLDMLSIVVAGREQVSSQLPDEAVILDLKDGVYYGLGQVGALVWDLIQRPVTVEGIRDAIVQEYAVSPERCERDLLLLLQQLADKGLIEVSASTDA